MKKLLFALTLTVALVGCERAADVASRNLSEASDNFEVIRRVVFYNTITDTYMLKMEGPCSIGNNDTPGRLSVTCKLPDGKFVKNILVASDNVSVIVEQVAGADVSTYHYRTVFRPQTIVPDIDFQGDADEILRNRN